MGFSPPQPGSWAGGLRLPGHQAAALHRQRPASLLCVALPLWPVPGKRPQSRAHNPKWIFSGLTLWSRGRPSKAPAAAERLVVPATASHPAGASWTAQDSPVLPLALELLSLISKYRGFLVTVCCEFLAPAAADVICVNAAFGALRPLRYSSAYGQIVQIL